MIELKRRLHNGIYRSSGGGEVRSLQQWRTNPRNLVAAAKLLPTIYQRSVESYGKIGAGDCWIEVDGVELSDYEAGQIEDARVMRDYERFWHETRLTATQYAARLIAEMTQPVEDGQHRIRAA